MSVRVRYAPSPTGDLHLGSMRTVIFDVLFAQQNQGTFIVRIEDTDRARLVEGSVERQLEGLEWMGIIPDEGVYLDGGEVKERGEFGPYIQSKRLDIYKQHAEELIKKEKAYRCFCTAERLEEMRAEHAKNHQAPRYDRHCRNLSPEESTERAKTEKYVVRHAIPDGEEVVVPDLVRDETRFQSSDLDDYVLLKSDGFPTYQLASVVDDHLMQITHVLRGDEWIPSTPKNLLLYQAFGWQPPIFAHLPVILGPDGKHKLSKRDGSVNILDYRDKGYLPEALFNVLAFQGWSPGTEDEFFTKEELVKVFNLEKVQKSPAVFSFDRLDYVNGWYIRHLSVEEVAQKMLPYLWAAKLVEESNDYVLKVAGLLQERLKHFDETEAVSWFFFKRPTVDDELKQLIVPKKGDFQTTISILKKALEALKSQEDWTVEALERLLRDFIEKHELKAMEVLWPIRAALTGVSASPGTFEMLAVLGKEESLARLEAVLT